ncbi:hypothetical protein LTR50_007609 [Elasticomyces elasticus]|nr:hypothetical protein LTR50_007609 [Elasticomyces elasticus]
MEDPGSPGDTITVLGRGVRQEAAAKGGPGRPKAREKRRRHQEDEGDTDFEAPISFNGAVDTGFTRATKFDSGSNSKDPGLQNTLADQRETQAREVKDLIEQQEQAQKKAAEVAEEAVKELKDQIESLKEDIKAMSLGQLRPERTQIGQGESIPRSHPTSVWPSIPISTAERPTTVSHTPLVHQLLYNTAIKPVIDYLISSWAHYPLIAKVILFSTCELAHYHM